MRVLPNDRIYGMNYKPCSSEITVLSLIILVSCTTHMLSVHSYAAPSHSNYLYLSSNSCYFCSLVGLVRSEVHTKVSGWFLFTV